MNDRKHALLKVGDKVTTVVRNFDGRFEEKDRGPMVGEVISVTDRKVGGHYIRMASKQKVRVRWPNGYVGSRENIMLARVDE